MRRVVLAAGVAAIAALAAGCGSSASSGSGSSSSSSSSSPHVTLRLGFLANITHAPALVGLNKGFFTKNLGDGVILFVRSPGQKLWSCCSCWRRGRRSRRNKALAVFLQGDDAQ